MPLVINTNVASLRSQDALSVTQSSLQKSFLRLSSGYRINSAADDAAGLAISEGLRGKVRSYAVAERNTNNAISMTVVAESGLGQISAIVIRMRELAVQSASGDLSSTDRSYLDTEFQLLKDEIDRLANSTEFNGTVLLGGTATTIDFQVGIGTTSNDVISLDFGGITTSALGLSGVNVSGSTGSVAFLAIDAVDAALQNVSTVRARYGAATNRLQIAVTNTQVIRTNMAAANSAIRDVDVAEETAQLARSQVLLQAGASVLSQANQAPQLALQLLGR
ncbi:MAG: flagellin FliC [Deltaproteobacteria bacterium]|nr:flagellin FliC [Deltaproteobacteria bacterium]